MFSLDKQYEGWSMERIARHILYWAFWLIFYGSINGSYHEKGYGVWLLFELEAMTIKLPYAYFMAYYLVPKLLPQKRYALLVIVTVALAFVCMSAILKLNEYFPYDMPSQPDTFWSGKMFYRTLDLINIAGMVVIIKMAQRFLHERQMNSQLKEEKIGAELQLLKNQLQPHFLFNTLNNIYGMVLSGDKKAADAVLQLSNIISYMLYESNEDFVDLDKEVKMLTSYIDLERIRYGDRLEHSFEVHGNPQGKLIAPFLLISFMENAYKHGMSKSAQQSWIRTDLQIDDDQVTFIVENPVPTDPEESHRVKSGIGLENVRKRLELLYPDRHSLNITHGESFLINLKIRI
jgi:two-component system LytT family sensor kinase